MYICMCAVSHVKYTVHIMYKQPENKQTNQGTLGFDSPKQSYNDLRLLRMAELLHQSVTIRNIIQHCNYDGIIMGSLLPATKSRLVYMTSITTVYANCDYSIHGGCKPTYNWGSSTLYQEGQEDQV